MRRMLIFMTMLVCLLILLPACTPEEEITNGTNASAEETAVTEATAEYRKITAEEAKAMMDENENIIIVDVRTQEEFDETHIEGAILIPNETITDSAPEELSDLNATILVYCRSGRRSEEAARKLVDLGYTNVYDFGGIIDWPYGTTL